MKLTMILIALATLPRADAAPKIQFDKTIYDFGVTALVESVTGTFTFQNVGDSVLELQKPKPSCGCTVAKVNPETLKPGEKGELVFMISLASGNARLSKEIYVSSNDPENPTVQLGIKVEKVTVLQAEPPAAAFGNVRLGVTTNTAINIRRLDGKKLVITKVEASGSLMEAKVEPTTGTDPTTTRLSVELKAEGLPRHVSEQLRLYTDDSAGAAFVVFASAQLLGDIKLEPEMVSWGVPETSYARRNHIDIIREQTLTISSTQTNRPLELRNVTCDLKELSVNLATLQEGKQYELRVRLLGRLKESLHGTISFDTNLPSLPTVHVPVEINVWKP